MMTEQQATDFAESSAIAVFDGEGSADEHRDNIRDTLNDERSSEHEAAAFAAFDAKLASLVGVDAAPVIRPATRESMIRDGRRWAAGVVVDPRRPYDAKLARLDAALASRVVRLEFHESEAGQLAELEHGYAQDRYSRRT